MAKQSNAFALIRASFTCVASQIDRIIVSRSASLAKFCSDNSRELFKAVTAANFMGLDLSVFIPSIIALKILFVTWGSTVSGFMASHM